MGGPMITLHPDQTLPADIRCTGRIDSAAGIRWRLCQADGAWALSVRLDEGSPIWEHGTLRRRILAELGGGEA